MSLPPLLIDWLAPLVCTLAVAACVMRARRSPSDALAWKVFAGGIASYGTAYAVLALTGGGDYADAPFFCHVLWLAFYPAAYTAVLLLVRARIEHFPRGIWLDGVIGALTLAGFVAAFALPAFEDAAGTSAGVVALLVYPACDIVMLTVALLVLSLARWRGLGWWLIAVAFAVFAVGDMVLAYQGATDTFVRGSLIDTMYPAALGLIGVAALRDVGPIPRRAMDGPGLLLLPAACIAVNIVLIFIDQFVELPNDDVILAMPAVALGMVRGLITLGDVRRLYESRRFERGFQDATIGMAMIDTDIRYMRVNDALAEMLGYEPEEMIGRTTLELTHPDDRELSVDVVDDALTTGNDPRFSKRLVRKDGMLVDVLVTSTVVEDDDGSRYFFSQIQDVTRERRADRQKEAIAALGRFALATTDIGALAERAVATVTTALSVEYCTLMEAVGDDQLRVEAIAPRGNTGTLIPRMGFGAWVLDHEESTIADDLSTDERFSRSPQGEAAGVRRAMGVPIRTRRGTERVLSVFERSEHCGFVNDDVLFLEAVANVITSAVDRSEAEEELRRRALEDPLTGLANRTLLGSHLERALFTALRHDTQVAVLMLDLDRFKYLNDTLGHGIGDELLIAVAERLKAAVRDEDLVARLGGDEFVVVCGDTESDAAIAEVAQRLVDVLADPFGVAGRELHVSASVGVAVASSVATADNLLRDADAAMYRAKERGGGRYEIFDAALRARLLHRVSTEEALRHALKRDELRVRYQPIVDPITGAVHAFEALLRWHHPDRGIVSPGEFVPVAEETGLIVPIGAWVLRTACEQAASFNAERGASGPVAISVNLSPVQVRPELLFEVRRALAGTIPPHLLMLEITESLLLDPDASSGVIADLRELGVRVALDDFGTGYSSLSYLQSFPLDVVKLDRSFVQSLDGSERTAAVVRAAIQMAAALGLSVVAEGVQRPEQLRLLRDLDCHFVQGFLFAPALDPAEASELLGGVDIGAAVTLPAPAPLRAPRVGSVHGSL